MKKLIIVLLLLALLCGCKAEEQNLPVSASSDSLPIDFQARLSSVK